MDRNSNLNINLSKNAKLAIGIGLIVCAILIPILFRPRSTVTTAKPEHVESIRLKKKGEEITINRHGQVTIKSGDKLIMQYWDKNRIDEIFAKFDKIEKTSFSRDGKSIVIDLDNEEQAEELAGLGIFSDEETETIVELLAGGDSVSPTPTEVFAQTTYRPAQPTSRPTGQYGQPTYPTPTSFSQPKAEATQKPFRCIFEEPEEGRDGFIISETVCTELID